MERSECMTVMIWLIAAVLLAGIEILTLGLTTIWFAGGALVAALFAWLAFPIWAQVAAFAVVSILLLVPIRPWALKHLNGRTVRTNADSLIGQICLVTEEIDNLNARGQVKIRGQVWTARTVFDDMHLQEGDRAVVEAISGVKLLVRPE